MCSHILGQQQMTERLAPSLHTQRRRWWVLALGAGAQTASCCFLYGIPFLVPAMRAAEGLSLTEAGVVVAAPLVGLLLTLILWGAAADRYGERLVMAAGLGGAGLLQVAAALAGSGFGMLLVLLGLAGAASASVNAASGRVVVAAFSAKERGIAMGIRQTAQPVGVGLAALVLPRLAERMDFRLTLLFPAALCLLAAVVLVLFLVEPPREVSETAERAASPYREPVLWRLHSASALLVVPQFAIAAFAVEYLVSQQSWSPAAAGTYVAAVQLVGAAGRLVSGYWSDRVASRLRPMRQLAVASATVMVLLAVGDGTADWVAVAAIALGGVITVADNGLGFTSAAELAGSSWAGRALGAQNTGQNLAAALTPPVLGLVIGGSGYGAAFAAVAVLPLLAAVVTPVAAEHAAARR
jgi:sugar phosphate permease